MSRSVPAAVAALWVAFAATGCGPAGGGPVASSTSPQAPALSSQTPSNAPTVAASTPPGAVLPAWVVAEIRVGDGPGYADIADGAVWVGNHRSNSISRIDPASNSVTATVPVPRDPTGITAGFGSIWTFAFDPTGVTRVDIATNEVVVTIPISAPGGSYTGLVEGGDSMWIAPEGGRLYRIDPEDNTATDVAGLDTDCPGSLAFIDGSLWHVPLCGAPVVLRINPDNGKVLKKVEVPADSHAVWAGLDRLWAVTAWGELTEIDPAANEALRSKSVGLAAEQVRTGLGAVWVRVDDRTLVAVDPTDLSIQETYTLPPAQIPGGGIAISDDAVWAVNFAAGTVWRIEP
jgi:YVTN family beta-propeller protein